MTGGPGGAMLYQVVPGGARGVQRVGLKGLCAVILKSEICDSRFSVRLG